MKTNHPLAAWIDQRMSRAEFARRVEISPPFLSQVLQGKRGMSLELSVRIERETGGEFTAARLLEQQMAMMEAAR